MQIINLEELINKMGKGEVISQDDIIDILGSFLKDADVGEVHVHNCSKCGGNVHDSKGKKGKSSNIKSNINANHHKECDHGGCFCADKEDVILGNHNAVPTMGSHLSGEDIALLNFADMYISAYKAGENMEEYRKFFIDNVLPVPTLQGIAKYIK